MQDDDPMPDPHSPEWTVAWTVRRMLRMYFGPRLKRFLSKIIADEVIKDLRGSNWLITKGEPPPPFGTPGPTSAEMSAKFDADRREAGE